MVRDGGETVHRVVVVHHARQSGRQQPPACPFAGPARLQLREFGPSSSGRCRVFDTMAPLNFAGAMAKMNLPDYLQWIAAPWPFLLPWLLICTDPLPYLLKPELWQANFLQLLSANKALWFAAYYVARCVLACGRL
jgi:hypothetical protein